MRALLLLPLLLLAAPSCSGDDCGPGDAPANGVTVTTQGSTITYGDFTSSPNNDCTTGAETSLSIEGVQVEPTPVGAIVPKIAFCIPLPDSVGGDAMALGYENTDPVRLVDVNASVDPCTYRLEFTVDPSATIAFSGYCGNGTDPAGYAIALDGEVTLHETCGTDLATVSATLAGSAAVTSQNP